SEGEDRSDTPGSSDPHPCAFAVRRPQAVAARGAELSGQNRRRDWPAHEPVWPGSHFGLLREEWSPMTSTLIEQPVENRRGRHILRTSLQAGLSLVLLGVLVWLARQGSLLAAFRSIRPSVVALAAGLYVAASLLNARRWQLLLRHQGIDESLRELGTLYFIGQFCSLFLPTAAGGDAVRVA